MKAYLDLVRNVLDCGISKQPTRMVDGKAVKVDNGTIGLPAQTFIHDMRTGFPALTTRKIAFRSTMVELEGFIHGVTDKQWYKSRGCHFWDYWANPEAVKNLYQQNYVIPVAQAKEKDQAEGIVYVENPHYLPPFESVQKGLQEYCNDLGPVYGFQWRYFDQDYFDNRLMIGFEKSTNRFVNFGQDQFRTIVESLKKNPYDRRMVCSAWNPNQIKEMALPPCHFAWNVVVYGDTISLVWHQRSCDLMCGVSHNIASYAALLCLLGKVSNKTPWLLKGDLNDCHIYENQIDQAKEQLEREPRQLPQVEILSIEKEFDIFRWTHKDIQLVNYDPHPPMKFEVTV